MNSKSVLQNKIKCVFNEVMHKIKCIINMLLGNKCVINYIDFHFDEYTHFLKIYLLKNVYTFSI